MKDNKETVIYSPLFGPSVVPDEYHQYTLDNLVERSPVAVFQSLNRKMNSIGFVLSISTRDEMH